MIDNIKYEILKITEISLSTSKYHKYVINLEIPHY